MCWFCDRFLYPICVCAKCKTADAFNPTTIVEIVAIIERYPS